VEHSLPLFPPDISFSFPAFPWIPLYSFSHSVRRAVEGDNSIINLVSGNCFGLIGKGEGGVEMDY